jgi:hypothetical protein
VDRRAAACLPPFTARLPFTARQETSSCPTSVRPWQEPSGGSLSAAAHRQAAIHRQAGDSSRARDTERETSSRATHESSTIERLGVDAP